MDASPEQKLLHGAHRLDPYALAEIYNQYNGSIYAYSMHLLGEPDLAEECVSETFSRFLKAVYAGNGPQSHLKAYLYRIAHNWVTDYYRRKPNIPLETIENMQLDGLPTAQDSLDKKFRRSRIMAALRQLTEMQRQVIVLLFLEDLENEEVAAAISKPISAIRAIKYRAIGKLRKILAQEEAE
jgi:RNA polymerase sigma-70 factor, ECF subfamily